MARKVHSTGAGFHLITFYFATFMIQEQESQKSVIFETLSNRAHGNYKFFGVKP